jgi:hypothetical protein
MTLQPLSEAELIACKLRQTAKDLMFQAEQLEQAYCTKVRTKKENSFTLTRDSWAEKRKAKA